MASALRIAALAAFAAVASAGGAAAQDGSQTCVRLESQLAAIEAGSGSAEHVRRLEDSAAHQRAELARAHQMARSMNCGGGGFLFGPAPAPQCRDLEGRIVRMERGLGQTNAELQRARGGAHDAQHRQVLAALAQNGCGPQYRAAVPVRQPPRQRGGLLDLLFGGRGDEPEGPAEMPPVTEPPHPSSFRTVCVRLCDGFFFPVSYSVSPARFGPDETICRRTCPGTEAALFTYPNPGGAIENAVSTNGTPYRQLPNAFLYQKRFVPDCSCKPANMSWAEALANTDTDATRGDIVVDENRSRIMSQPPTQPPAPPLRGRAPIRADSATVGGPPADLSPPPLRDRRSQAAPPPYRGR